MRWLTELMHSRQVARKHLFRFDRRSGTVAYYGFIRTAERQHPRDRNCRTWILRIYPSVSTECSITSSPDYATLNTLIIYNTDNDEFPYLIGTREDRDRIAYLYEHENIMLAYLLGLGAHSFFPEDAQEKPPTYRRALSFEGHDDSTG